MTHRDFIVASRAIAMGEELSINRIAAGWETTCTLCGVLITRREPPGNHATVTRPLFALRLDVRRHFPGAAPADRTANISTTVDLCLSCGILALSPFGPVLADCGLALPDVAAVVEQAADDELRAAVRQWRGFAQVLDDYASEVLGQLAADVDEHQAHV